MQNASDIVDKASTPVCCFWWEITRGPHENAMIALCVHEGAGASAVREGLKVGRQKRCWMRLLKDLEVSSVHAEFRLADGEVDTTEAIDKTRTRQVVLCDLNSTNGTKLNGEPLVPRQEYSLTNQDLIHFGKTAVRFRVADRSLDAFAVANEVTDHVESSAVNSADENGKYQQKVQGEPLVVDLTDDVCESNARYRANAESDHPKSLVPGDRANQDGMDSNESSVPTAQDLAHGDGGFATDDDVFEAPITSHIAQLPAQTSSSVSSATAAAASTPNTMTCMICGQWLGHLDVLEQQLHINGCLDRRNQVADNWLLPPPPQQSTSGRSQNQGKKRKRGRTAAAATTIEDDEVTMALAMSRSLANKEQEVDMEMALLSGELAQIDTQMMKLAKKREALLKKMAKLEKTKAKVQKSAVIPPAEARVLLDLSRVLQLLFPMMRVVPMDDLACSPAEFKRVRFVVSKYAPQTTTTGLDSNSSWRLPSMWLRASQQLFGHTERELYSNSILLPFAHIKARKKGENAKSDTKADTISTISEIERHEQKEIDVPDSIKRVFPDYS